MEAKESKDKNKSEDENDNRIFEEGKDINRKILEKHKYKLRNDVIVKNVFLFVCIIGVSSGILLEVMNVRTNEVTKDVIVKQYWVYSAHSDVENENGLLKHVHLVLKRLGYEKVRNNSNWELLWSHDYPFRALYPSLHRLKSNQRVNHFPGTGYITNKVDLAVTESKYIPKAFKLPGGKEDFLKYVSENKNALFLEKHNQHRGVYLKNVSEIDTASGESFVQEYIRNPFLVDGHKFDIGVYVVITSVDPLRVYWYKGDVLFRYCPAKYHPFNPDILDKYVIGDDYLPTWEVPSLAHPYTALGLGMKDSFDVYARSKGKDTAKMWEEVQKAIAEVFIKKEHHIIEALKSYPSSQNFFELMRFDLVVDEDLKVYLLEANMSPNLSSAHYPPNQLLYEQVLYNLLSLTGVANHVKEVNEISERERLAVLNMISSQKNIAVWGDKCASACKDDCAKLEICALCKPCLEPKVKISLLKAHKEFLHRGDFRRLFPPPSENTLLREEDMYNWTKSNKLHSLWFQGKCEADLTWCT